MRSGIAVVGMCLVVAVLAVCTSPATVAGPAKPVVKIGVYDSRGVAIAYARSPGFTQSMMKLRADYERARAEGDSALVKKLGQEGPWMQVRLHQRGFSTAGAGDLLAKVADRLPGVAREAGVVLIVSKWEMPFRDASVEVVDVTVPLMKLFQADEQTLKIAGELASQKPISLDELPLDAND
jgi:hypothetical protein